MAGVNLNNGTEQIRPNLSPLNISLGKSPGISKGKINHITLARIWVVNNVAINVSIKGLLPGVLRH